MYIKEIDKNIKKLNDTDTAKSAHAVTLDKNGNIIDKEHIYIRKENKIITIYRNGVISGSFGKLKMDYSSIIQQTKTPTIYISIHEINKKAKQIKAKVKVVAHAVTLNKNGNIINREYVYIRRKKRAIVMYRDGSVGEIVKVTENTIDDILLERVKRFLFDIDWYNEL